uniref:RGS domain-containing protein n=1 Tax=Lotharella globosa TaxID=91324 RepID=A0A7S3Z179_9EUKA
MSDTGTGDHGKSDDPSQDVALAVHWGITVVLTLGFVAVSVYTQRKLLMLHRENASLQMLDHPHQVTALLSFILLWSIPPPVQFATPLSMPCSLYVLWTQLAGAGFVTLHAYRTLRFTYRMAQVQCCRAFVRSERREGWTQAEIDYQKFVKWIVRSLRGWTIPIIAACVMTFGLGILFIDPYARLQLTDKTSLCTLRTSTLLFVAWLLWLLPYFCFITKVRQVDPFRILVKLKVLTVAGFGMIVCYAIGDEFLRPLVGEAQWALITNKLWLILQLTTWYTESYLPLHLTQQRMQQSPKHVEHHLADTIANPVLLAKFEAHLVSEWSPESIQFYKAITFFQLEAEKALQSYFGFRDSKASAPEPIPRFGDTHESLGGVALDGVESKKLRNWQPSRGTALSSARTVHNFSENQTLQSKRTKEAWRNVLMLRMMALEIYETYVRTGAENEVNIPRRITNPLHKYFNTPEFRDLKREEEKFGQLGFWRRSSVHRKEKRTQANGSRHAEPNPITDGRAEVKQNGLAAQTQSQNSSQISSALSTNSPPILAGDRKSKLTKSQNTSRARTSTHTHTQTHTQTTYENTTLWNSNATSRVMLMPLDYVAGGL